MGHFRARVEVVMARRGKLTGTHGRLGPWEMWVAVSVSRRERETERKRRCQQVHRGGWDEKGAWC